MDYQKIGALIRRLRQERGLTQRELAAALSLSPKTVSKWERGAGCPDVSLLEALSGALQVNIPALLSGDPGGKPAHRRKHEANAIFRLSRLRESVLLYRRCRRLLLRPAPGTPDGPKGRTGGGTAGNGE